MFCNKRKVSYLPLLLLWKRLDLQVWLNVERVGFRTFSYSVYNIAKIVGLVFLQFNM